MNGAAIGHIKDTRDAFSGAVSLTPDILKILEETREGAMEEIEAAKKIIDKKTELKRAASKITKYVQLNRKILEFINSVEHHSVCNKELIDAINKTKDYSESADKQGYTLLMLLMMFQKYDLAKELLEKENIDTTKTNSEGKTALSYIKNYQEKEGEEMIRLIIEKGGDPNDSLLICKGEPLISTFIKIPNFHMMMYLISKGANVNLPDPNGITPLMQTIICGKSILAETLLRQQADPNIKDNLGKDSMDYCIEGMGKDYEKVKIGNVIYNNEEYGYKKPWRNKVKAILSLLYYYET